MGGVDHQPVYLGEELRVDVAVEQALGEARKAIGEAAALAVEFADLDDDIGSVSVDEGLGEGGTRRCRSGGILERVVLKEAWQRAWLICLRMVVLSRVMN
ncbi:hypothetical protein [Mesorhizobium sp. M0047]|uniref:hypothetical protein n=1 Tax=Mesorhizobium sp. M0047 TaxID=2956859 RepID=UPI003338E69A